MRKLLLTAILAAFPFSALAADVLATKAPAAFSFKGYPVDSGLYFGLNGAIAGGSANGVSTSTTSANTGKLFTAEGDLGFNLGYVLAKTGQPVWYAVEATFDWSNINGQTQGFSVSGPWNFEQIAILGAPWDQVVSLIPNLTGVSFPGLPQLPSNLQAGPGAVYVFGGLREQDVSSNFNVGSGHGWMLAGIAGVGSRWKLSNFSALDVRAEYISPSNSICFVNGANQGCGGLGSGLLMRTSILW